MIHTYLVCFDITDDKNRRFISRRLEHEGLRVQYSVFEVPFATPSDLTHLKNELREWMEPEDDIRFYHLCSACRKKSLSVDDERIASFPLAVVL